MLRPADLRDPSFTNADLRAYEADLIRDAAVLRSEAQQLDHQLAAALADLRAGGDYYLAEAISLIISLGGIITFQWLAVVGGFTGGLPNHKGADGHHSGEAAALRRSLDRMALNGRHPSLRQ